MAAAGAVMVNVLVGVDPAAQAEPGTPQSVSVAQELGLSAQSAPIDVTEDLEPLQDLAASRSTREAEQVAAQQAQAAADQAVLDQQKAEAEAAARAAAEAQAAAAAEAQAAAEAEVRAAEERAAAEAQAAAPTPRQQAEEAVTAAASVAATAVARITNNAGSVRPQVQRAADAVVSNVPGAGSITLGGTRASAADPGGHPSGLALDYMVMSDAALGDAIVAYHRAHWAELGVDYLIWQQRMLSSPGGSWQAMENRGSATANHYDHVHVNYRG
ncbi:Peptidoglycan-binding coiled-coil domain protein [Blastococcus saxobsidens DD2]|uniref:Peptidoglycan-binding coiled-coil domain protein n=2 Tax=Blastococcus saxobsidens TaxID=138336 RepID=H6RLL0_BLASD|nr:Peptidoglycan-binding coiled-coil domain protein [Blastococcus saxobsidens DD2]